MAARRWRRDRRLLRGFLIAPAVVPAASALSALALARLYTAQGRQVDPDALAFILDVVVRFGLPAAYVFAAAVAVPYVLSMYQHGLLDFWTLMTPLTVVASGLVVVTCIAAPRSKDLAAVFAAGTEAAGLCFYVLSVWRNPACSAPRSAAAASLQKRADI